jgi:hypothetical protein
MAWYRTGTVTVTNGSGTIAGSGTAFIANVSIGEAFLGPDGRTYEITDIPSNTSLTISPNYLGSNASGQVYAILPARGRIADLIAETQSLLSSFATVRDGIGAGLFPDGSAATPAFRFTNDQDTGFYRLGSNVIGVATGGAVRMQIGDGGNVGIGAAPSGSYRVLVSRGDSGNIAQFTDGVESTFVIRTETGILQIGQANNLPMAFLTNGVERFRITATGNILTGADNTQNLGGASNRWAVVYAGTGTINTSDERDKHWRGELNAAELRAAKRIIGELGIYQWNDAVEEKGEDGARLHFGIRAQQAFAILDDEGLEWQRYAWCCHDQWQASSHTVLDDEGEPTGETRVTPAGDRYGVRPDQLAFWLIAAQAAMQADLEARLAALEAPA